MGLARCLEGGWMGAGWQVSSRHSQVGDGLPQCGGWTASVALEGFRGTAVTQQVRCQKQKEGEREREMGQVCLCL